MKTEKKEVLKSLNKDSEDYKQPPEVSREEIISKNLFNADEVNKELIRNGYKPVFLPCFKPKLTIPHNKYLCVDTEEDKGKIIKNTIKELAAKPKRIEKRKSIKADEETYQALLMIHPQPIIALRIAVKYYLDNHKTGVKVNGKK